MQINWSLLDPKKWWAAHRMAVVKQSENTYSGDCPWRTRHKQPGSIATIEVGDAPEFRCTDPFCRSHTFESLTEKWPDGWCYAQDLSSSEDIEDANEDDGFEPLGFTPSGTYMYQSVRTGHVVEMKASNHTEINLYALVPSGSFWKQYCGGSSISWKKIARDMMRSCQDKGYYMHTETRGAGMFIDRNRIVVNLGAHLIVNEPGSDAFVPIHMANFRGDYNYATPRRLVLPPPMEEKEIDKILPIFEMMPWQDKGDALILAGAIICGHMAGALKWRPHFWLTGAAGSGKSDIFNKIVGALQPFPMLFEGSTSAAGIRDSIANSSGLVGVDEMEKQGGSSERMSSLGTIKRVDSIMEMMRSASSGSRAKVAKGGPDGKGFEVQFKCCAFFCSIYYGVEMAQDYRRFCFMRLQSPDQRAPEQKEVYQREIQPLLEKTFTPEFAMRLYSWAVANSRKILSTIDYFKSEMLKFCKDAGEADQWSAVLGAAWALTRHGQDAKAADVVAMFEMCAANRMAVDNEIKDASHSERVFHALMQGIPQGEHYTIGSQIAVQRRAIASGMPTDDDGAHMWLAQRGIVVGKDEIYVCVGHQQLSKVLAAAGYSDYRQALLGRHGVRIEHRKMEFAGFMATRVLVIPLEPMGERQREKRPPITAEDVERYGRRE